MSGRRTANTALVTVTATLAEALTRPTDVLPFARFLEAGQVEAELVPQGTLAERRHQVDSSQEGAFEVAPARSEVVVRQADQLAREPIRRAREAAHALVDDALAGCDDGELFLEYEQSESLAFDDGKLKSASYDTTQGFGLRSVAGEATGFAHASALDEQALKRAVAINGSTGTVLGRSLMNLRDLVDSTLSDIRMSANVTHRSTA